MPTVLSIVLSLFGLFLLHLLLGVRRVARDVGSVVISILKYPVDQPLSNLCSNLSGPFFLFDPLSDVGFLIARIFGHIPYLLVGGTWAPGGKYEGTCA
jgi:hypothetical protein